MISNKRWVAWMLVGAAPAVTAVVGAASCVGTEPVVSPTTGGAGGGGSTCPLAVCGSVCTDTKVDPANCGACGNACTAGEVCAASMCATSCPSAQTQCGMTCADTQIDPANCGACGKACTAGEVCAAGTCATSCPSGQVQCGSICSDTQSDPANCGTCGKACAAGDVCAAGTCSLVCPSSLSLCDSALCVDLTSSNAHCGACDTPCSAGQTCTAGQCGLVCEAGLMLCGAPEAADGGTSDAGAAQRCIDPTHDSANCGACGTVCGPGEYCSASACAYPTSCADILTHTGPAVDGSYVIQPAGLKPYTVYCAGMATATPKEYLTLFHTYGNGATAQNFSLYDKTTCHCADNAYRYFEKVRINPATLVVDVTDATFAANVTTDPTCWASYTTGICSTGNKLNYAEAANCILNGVAVPGNVDFEGTTFSIDPSVTFVPNGFDPYGTSTFSTDRKIVNFTGGGDCGQNNPMGALLLKQD